MKTLSKFFKYFPDNKNSFKKYSVFSFLVGITELFGVALTYPFVINLLQNRTSKFIYSPIFIGIAIILLFILKNVFMIFYTFLQTQYTKSIDAELKLKFMKYFLASDYQISSKVSFAEKSNILNYYIPNVINNYILRLLNLNVNFFIFVLILTFLVIKFPLATIITTLFAAILLASQNAYFKPKLLSISSSLKEKSYEYNQTSNEALINIKGVKASNNEKHFYNNYKNAILNFNNSYQESTFLNLIPPYITEPLIIILLFILLAVISLQNYAEPQKLMASFAVIVSAIFRLAPTLSRIQVNLNGLSSSMPIVKTLLELAEEYDLMNISPLKDSDFMHFNDNIRLENVSFGYKPDKTILKNINLKIKKGEFIGIAGLSGAGKTTLADIIAGLLRPDSGKIVVDNSLLTKPLSIGYITQEFSTISASIRENVAYGAEDIDDTNIINALKQAQLYDFIQENYKEGIYANPFVDSTGFSQGQKQRLAIARALYLNPDILILDEATSSLDLKTEDELSNILEKLKGEKTIIAIAHRLSTIKNADRIIFMQNGAIKDIAPFNELVDINKDFEELVKLGSLN